MGRVEEPAAISTSVADPSLAAEMVVQVVEAVAHGLVIHPRPGRDPEAYATETVAMLCGYLGAADRPG